MVQIIENNPEPAVTQPTVARSTDTRAVQIVYLIISIIEILLAFRLVMRLLGANSLNAFVAFIYAMTYPLIVPFVGIFSLPKDLGVASFEIATLVAMAVYAVIGYIIVAILGISRRRTASEQ